MVSRRQARKQEGIEGEAAAGTEMLGPPWARVLRVVGYREAARLLSTMGVDDREIGYLREHALHRLVQVGPLPNALARKLKRQFTHIGGEAAMPGSAAAGEGETEVILMGRLGQFYELERRLAVSLPDLRPVGEAISAAFRRDEGPAGVFRARDFEIGQSSGTQVMGILNATPDSFSDGGLFADLDAAVKHGVQMAAEGAGIIDVGGASSRPGADEVSAETEAERVVPVIEKLVQEVDVPVSVDTTHASVAAAAIEAGAAIVNDISALRFDTEMAGVVRASGAGLVMLHMRGNPKTMQENPVYGDVVGEVWRFLAERIVVALEAGIPMESIVADPGIGFGKNLEHNLTLLRRLGEFRSLGVPLLVGTSRKSLIGEVLELPIAERLEGTEATVAWSVFQGAWAVRVHDVQPAVRVCRMVDAILSAP